MMNEKLKTLKFIHFAICIGMIVAYIFAGEITMEQLKSLEIKSDDLIYLAIPIGAVLLSNFMFKNQLKQVDPKITIEQKLPVYQTASIIRWAIIEAAAFIILFVKPSLLVFGILLIVYLAYLRPSEDRIRRAFQMNI